MFKLKRITKESIPSALEKAERYRLLNEAAQAESICHDILEIDPENQKALVVLILALTDRFTKGYSVSNIQPQNILPRLKSEYERAYYGGIIFERKAKSKLANGSPDANYIAYDLFREAMLCYEKAESLRTAGNDDPILRWNTCVRIMTQNKLSPKIIQDEVQPFLE